MNYDAPDVFYDMPGLYYDMPETGPNPAKAMAKPKLELKQKSILERVQMTTTINAMMTGNPNFTAPNPVPNPSLASVQAQADAVQAALEQRDQLRQQLAQQQTTLQNEVSTLDNLLTQLAGYVESASGGDPDKILSAGFALRGSATVPPTMPQVVNLRTETGAAEGEVVLRWNTVKSAYSYEVQTSPDPFTASSWTSRDPVTKALLRLTGLPSTGRCWFRVRAIGAAGPGPWSDPAVKTVP